MRLHDFSFLTDENILFLRPGHINPRFTIQTIRSLFATDPELLSLFILVARRIGNAVQIRVRNL